MTVKECRPQMLPEVVESRIMALRARLRQSCREKGIESKGGKAKLVVPSPRFGVLVAVLVDKSHLT